MDIIIFKQAGNEPVAKPFQKAKLIHEHGDNITIETEGWFSESLGVEYFVDTGGPSGALASVSFDPNSEMKPPYTFYGTIDRKRVGKKYSKPVE